MKVIIAGSRHLTDAALLYPINRLMKAHFPNVTTVVSGCADGVDGLGEIWADLKEIEISYHPANWAKFGKAAGYIRNKEMAEYGDALLALWDGQSPGTKNMIEIMRKLNKPVIVYDTEYIGN